MMTRTSRRLGAPEDGGSARRSSGFLLSSSGLLLLLLSLAGGCGAPEDLTETPPPPHALLDRWVAMWNSYDLEEVRELFLDDPRLTYFSSEEEGVIRGMEALLEHHRGFGFVPGGDSRDTRLWLEEVVTDLFGDAAVTTGLWYFESEEEVQRGPVTFVALWESGRWRFAHMNFSEYPPPRQTTESP